MPRETSEHMLRSTSIILLAGLAGACATVALKSGPLVDGYSRAACVPAKAADRYGLLAWDYSEQTRCHVHIVAVQRSSGSVVVEYPSDGDRRQVMHTGEKSNPAELRLDPSACRLYLRVNGSPILTNRPPMWLVEYDLLRREELQSAVVEPAAVPTTCAQTLDAGEPGVGPDDRSPSAPVRRSTP